MTIMTSKLEEDLGHREWQLSQARRLEHDARSLRSRTYWAGRREELEKHVQDLRARLGLPPLRQVS